MTQPNNFFVDIYGNSTKNGIAIASDGTLKFVTQDINGNQTLQIPAPSNAIAPGSLQVINSAKQILAAARSPTPDTNATVVPTVTIGTSNANSTIITTATVNSPTITLADTRIRPVSGLYSTNVGGYYQMYSARTSEAWPNRSPCIGSGFKFTTDSPSFDFTAQANADGSYAFSIWVRQPGDPYPLRVTDANTVNGDYPMTTGGVNQYIKVDFGSSCPMGREIEIRGNSNFATKGINVQPLYSIWKTKSNKPRILFLGDSFTTGLLSLNTVSSYAHRAAQLLGCEAIPSGLSSTGYIAAGSRVNLGNRLPDVTAFGTVDAIYIAMGVNDYAQNFTILRQVVTADLLAISALAPNTPIIVQNAWYSVAQKPTTGASNAILGGFNDAIAAGLQNAFFVDNIAENWVTGTGHYGGTTGDGNADFYVGTDGLHPTLALNAGHDFLGSHVATAISQVLSANYVV